MKNTLAICALISVLCGVRTACGQTSSSLYTDAEAYAVYSVIIETEWPVRAAKARKFVIQSETADRPRFADDRKDCLASPKGQEGMYDAVIAAYREVNKKQWLLQPHFDTPIPYQFVPKSSIEDLFAKRGVAGWKDFYTRYPDSYGVISMSAVGFNAARTIAIAYVGHMCGSLCGGGKYHILWKENGKWSDIRWRDMECAWAS